MDATKKELILSGLVALGLVLGVEAALRIAGFHPEPQLYTAHRDRGWALRPLAAGVASGEATLYVRVNSHGFRDRERTYAKASGIYRIAVLGNSWTEALQVPLEKTFCGRLETILNNSPAFAGRRVEVLNFGVSGYSTAQELLTLRQEVSKYHPDLVLVAFYSARDVANNVRSFNNANNPEQSPYFLVRDGRLVLDDSFRSLPAVQPRQIQLQTIRGSVNEHVRLLAAVNALVRAGRIAIAKGAVKERSQKAGLPDLEHAIYAAPSNAALEQAWRVTEALLVEMHREATAIGAVFRVVTLATRPQVLPDATARAQFMRTLGVANLSYADQRIDELAVRDGFAVTNLAPRLAAWAESHQRFLNGFPDTHPGEGHWNETGHARAAEAIAADLCAAPQQQQHATSLVALR